MPVIRVSQRLWKEVTEVAGSEGVSLSYALDKILDEARTKGVKGANNRGSKGGAKKGTRSRTKKPTKWVAGIVGLTEG